MLRPSLAFLVLVTAGCARPATGGEIRTGTEVAPPEAPAPEPAPAPAPPQADPATTRVAGAPLVFTAPAGWTSEAPSNSMRAAQFRAPRAAGDGEDGECVVFYFGEGGGGGVDANLERWCGQFTQPDGSDSTAAMVRSERSVHGMKVHEVELAGTFVAETSPGSGVRVNKPGFALRGAIVESDHGAYFVKFTGPAATVAQHADAFRALVSTVR